MAEINLLPDELRDKERKELKSVRSSPKQFRIEMSSPEKSSSDQPLKVSRPSLLSRLFSRKLEKPKPLAPEPDQEPPKLEDIKPERKTEAILHIPKIKSSDDERLISRQDKISENPAPALSKSFDQADAGKPASEASNEEETADYRRKVEQYIDRDKRDNQARENPAKERKKGFIFSLFGSKRVNRKSRIADRKSQIADRGSQIADRKSQIAGSRGKEKEKDERLDINLIPQDLIKYPETMLPKVLWRFSGIIFSAILIVTAIYFGILWYQFNITRQIAVLENEIKSLDIKIAGYEEDRLEALDLQKRLQLIRELLDKHIYWTQFFSLLERHTISDVYYTNFSMAGRDKLVISAVGKDYKSVAQQLVAFQEAGDFVKSVRIDSAAADVNPEAGGYAGVKFNINLEFLPNIFLKPIE
ncbi:hypothetical protein HYZ76_00220 [Candidatus Falkowbacteria bacterium]|nr:hypothetical protein [Candidatus Falkowbacteria bacterium]